MMKKCGFPRRRRARQADAALRRMRLAPAEAPSSDWHERTLARIRAVAQESAGPVRRSASGRIGYAAAAAAALLLATGLWFRSGPDGRPDDAMTTSAPPGAAATVASAPAIGDLLMPVFDLMTQAARLPLWAATGVEAQYAMQIEDLRADLADVLRLTMPVADG